METIFAVILLSVPLFQGQGADSANVLLIEQYSFGKFDRAARIAVGPQGWVYVVDTGRNSVLVFKDPKGQPVSVGGYGWGTTSFDAPAGIATDGINLYVADYGNHRIQRFDRSLNYVSTLFTRDTSFTPARFGYPSGVSLSRQGDLYVLDSENVRALKFSLQSRYGGSFGESESRSRKLEHPIKITVSRDDRIYVLEPHRIVEFDYFGNFLRSIGEGALRNASGFTLTDSHFIAVVPDKLIWFKSNGELAWTLPREGIIASEKLHVLSDAAIVEDQMFLLTTNRVHVFTVADGWK